MAPLQRSKWSYPLDLVLAHGAKIVHDKMRSPHTFVLRQTRRLVSPQASPFRLVADITLTLITLMLFSVPPPCYPCILTILTNTQMFMDDDRSFIKKLLKRKNGISLDSICESGYQIKIVIFCFVFEAQTSKHKNSNVPNLRPLKKYEMTF